MLGVLLLTFIGPILAFGGETYTNPVVDSNLPDPGVLKLDDGSFVAVTTTSTASSPDAFPILTSHDLVTWDNKGYVFPKGKWPSWVETDTWAPEIHHVNNNYIVYYSAKDKTSGKHAIGAAVSTTGTILGPYEDLGKPLVEDHTDPKYGLIDVHHYYDLDGTPYLLWKKDGFWKHEPDIVLMRKINKDGVSFNETEPVVEVLKATEDWEKLINEGPWIIHRNGYYYLFYSADSTFVPGYCVSVARSKSVQGPYVKYNQKILHTEGTLLPPLMGPGHGSVIQVGEVDWLVYHAWHGIPNLSHRAMLIDRVDWTSDGWPSIKQGFPTHTPQVAPLSNNQIQ